MKSGFKRMFAKTVVWTDQDTPGEPGAWMEVIAAGKGECRRVRLQRLVPDLMETLHLMNGNLVMMLELLEKHLGRRKK